MCPGNWVALIHMDDCRCDWTTLRESFCRTDSLAKTGTRATRMLHACTLHASVGFPGTCAKTTIIVLQYETFTQSQKSSNNQMKTFETTFLCKQIWSKNSLVCSTERRSQTAFCLWHCCPRTGSSGTLKNYVSSCLPKTNVCCQS